MSSSATQKKGMPDKDPYEVLGLTFGATEADISKAYRTLARKLHPDKLGRDLSKSAQEKAAARFQDIQNARAFLLDPDHASDKATYDNKRASDNLRQQTEAAREKGMSENRKRMRAELHRQEQAHRDAAAGATGSTTSNQSSHKKAKSSAADNKADLERQGRELREQYAAKAAAEASREQQQKAAERELRQIRLKWSRKKLKQSGASSPSEHSIAKQLSQFGTVEAVQMIGSKGNVALVTFAQDDDSADLCVQAYAMSEIWRASHLNKMKQQKHEEADNDPGLATATATGANITRDRENVDDWKLRQAAERERLMREMEDEDQGSSSKPKEATLKPTNVFPPCFPSTADFQAKQTPFKKLELAEQLILGAMLPNQK